MDPILEAIIRLSTEIEILEAELRLGGCQEPLVIYRPNKSCTKQLPGAKVVGLKSWKASRQLLENEDTESQALCKNRQVRNSEI